MCTVQISSLEKNIYLYHAICCRETAVGKFFYKAVATKESVRNILSQVLLLLITQFHLFKNLCFKECWVDKRKKISEDETIDGLE